MTLYEYICAGPSGCEEKLWVDWKSHHKTTKPHCGNCGNDTTTKLTGRTTEIKEGE